jgi:hypothetical protein
MSPDDKHDADAPRDLGKNDPARTPRDQKTPAGQEQSKQPQSLADSDPRLNEFHGSDDSWRTSPRERPRRKPD